MKSRAFLLLGLAIILGVIVVIFLRSLVFPTSYEFRGGFIDPPIPAKNFQLTDQNGEIFQLNSLRGKVIVMFFGYTYCPDVCPTTLADFKYVENKLGDYANDVGFVFVTVDPERDTPEQLRNFLGNFSPSIIGVTGSIEDLVPVWRNYGVARDKQDTGSKTGYLIEHTARIYVLDKDGGLRLTFPYGLDRESMLSDILYLVENSG